MRVSFVCWLNLVIGFTLHIHSELYATSFINQQVKKLDDLMMAYEWKAAIKLCDSVLTQNVKNQEINAQFALRKGILEFETGDIDKSSEIVNQYRNLEKRPCFQEDSILPLYYYLKGLIESFDMKYSSALQTFNKALNCIKNDQANAFIEFNIFKACGQIYQEMKNYSEARLNYEKAERKLAFYTKYIDFNKIAIDVLRGVSYMLEYKNDLAANLFNKCQMDLLKLGNPRHPSLTETYFQIIKYRLSNDNVQHVDILLNTVSDILDSYYYANNYRYLILDYYRGQYHGIVYDYVKASAYFQHVYNTISKYNYKRLNNYKFNTMQWMVYIAEKRNELQSALELNSDAIRFAHQAGLSPCYNYMETGYIYEKMNKIEDAVRYYQKAYSCTKTNPEFENRLIPCQTNLWLGKIYLKRNNISKAIYYLTEAARANQPDDIFDRQLVYVNLAKCFLKQKNYKAALDTLQSALIFSTSGFNNKSIYSNPEFSHINVYISINSVLNFKAFCLYYYYHDVSHNLADLEFSALTYQLSARLLEKKLASIDNELSELEYIESCKTTFNNTVELSHDVFEVTRNTDFALKSFEYAEKSKMLVLLMNQRKMNAKKYAGIPDSLIQLETKLRNEISQKSFSQFQKNEKSIPLQVSAHGYNQQLVKLYTQYDELQKTFEKNFPTYFNLKYNLEISPVKEIQQLLKPDQAILEYVITYRELYTFAITKDKLHIAVQSVDSSFTESIHRIRDFLSKNPLMLQGKKPKPTYTDDAYYLYKILIAPFSSIIKGKSLIIIPDEDLNLIPFEVLLTQPVQTTRDINYISLPYLAKQYPVSYAYSATLLKSNLQYKPKSHEKYIAAFFPDYSTYRTQGKSAEVGRFHDIMPLQATQDEIVFFRKLRRVIIFKDKKADESSFKKYAGKYSIVHISGHTIIDADNPQFSCLLFTRQNKAEDGILYSYEIYNNELNTQMLVLSSCNTGFGKMRKGEGLISLGRSFFYAGVRSLIITQWPVADKSSARLTSNLYSLMLKGETKDKALQKAKLKFLEQSDPLLSHPYFWSGYILMGDTDEIKYYRLMPVFYILSVLIIAGTLYFVVYKRKRAMVRGD